MEGKRNGTTLPINLLHFFIFFRLFFSFLDFLYLFKYNMTTVILIRHGEKHNWVDGNVPGKDIVDAYVDDHYLSNKGYERAEALVPYFFRRPEMRALFEKRPLGGLIAQTQDPAGVSAQSLRPLQTLVPLSKAVPNVPFATFIKSDIDKTLNYIKTKFVGKTVIVSWSHEQLNTFVTELTKGKVQATWPDKRYDVTWVLDTGNMSFTQFPQNLLFGDSNKN